MACCIPGSHSLAYRDFAIPARPALPVRTLSLPNPESCPQTTTQIKEQTPGPIPEYSRSLLEGDHGYIHSCSVSDSTPVCAVLNPSLHPPAPAVQPPAVQVRAHVDKFLLSGRSVGDSLNLVISPAVFDELCLHLVANTRYTYDYSTSRLIIHGLPTYYHEIGTPILGVLSRCFESQLGPKVNDYAALVDLASSIDWHGGGPSIRMVDGQGNKKAEKVPDASMGMADRRFPTVVVEVGKTQSLRSLRAAGRLWFAHQLEIPGTIGEGLKERNWGAVEASPGIELVILIDFAKGARTQGAEDEEDEDQPSINPKLEEHANVAAPPEGSYVAESFGADFTHVYLELWRCCSAASCRSAIRTQASEAVPPRRHTRSSTSRTRPNPHMCQRIQIYPTRISGIEESATFYLTDFVGSDSFDDPEGRIHMDVAAQVFGKCVDTIRSKVLSNVEGRRGVIRINDLEEARLGLDKGISAAHTGSGLERVLVERVNFLGEEILGKRRKTANARMGECGDHNGEGEHDENDGAGHKLGKRRKRI